MTAKASADRLFEALNAASLAAAQAHTAEEVYPAAAAALHTLGFHVNIYGLRDENTAELLHFTYAQQLVKQAASLAGQQLPFAMGIDRVPLFRDVLIEGQTRYVADTIEVLAHIVPGGSNMMARAIARMLGIGRLIGAPIRTDEGIRGMLVVLANDITASHIPAMEAFAHLLGQTVSRVSLLAQLQQSLAALEQSQAQLLHTQKVEAIGRLTAGIAHDFNNLLTPMYWAVEELKSRGFSPEHEALETLNQMLDSATHLTQQLLALGRKQVLQRTRIDLNQVAQRSVKLLGRILGEDVQVALELASEPVHIDGDRAQIEQILINLAVNARDALEPGGRVVFSTRDHSAAQPLRGTEAPAWGGCLSVRDNGAGMTPEVREHAFDPFFTTKAPGEGSGLGLSVVQGIVAQHGGRLELDSVVGKGTRVDIFFPPYEAHHEASAPPRPAPGAIALEEVWLLEDHPEVRRVFVRSLQRRGARVTEAETLAQARKLLADRPPPQLLISDVVLPDGTGLDFVQEVQARAPEVAVVIASGHPLNDDRGRRIDGLADAYLPKPFTQKLLTGAIAKAMAAARKRQANASSDSAPP